MSDPRSDLGKMMDEYKGLVTRVATLEQQVAELTKRANQLRVGTMLYGFCNGFFGRDSYEDKRVESFGDDWILARDEMGHVHYCHFPDEWLPKRDEMIAEWMKKPEGEQ